MSEGKFCKNVLSFFPTNSLVPALSSSSSLAPTILTRSPISANAAFLPLDRPTPPCYSRARPTPTSPPLPCSPTPCCRRLVPQYLKLSIFPHCRRQEPSFINSVA